MDWVLEEFSTLSLGDERLNARGHTLLSQLSHNPTDSIPVACSSASETKAAYRFLSNANIAPEKIHAPHINATLDRISQQKVVLVAQDSTVLNFTTQSQRTDTGPTVREASQGIYLHVSLALTPSKVSLGVLSVTQWHRKKLQRLTKLERSRKNLRTPIQEKESYRWIEHFQQMNEYARSVPNTLLVSIADREGDLYDLYAEAANYSNAKESNAHYLIRAQYDRSLCFVARLVFCL